LIFFAFFFAFFYNELSATVFHDDPEEGKEVDTFSQSCPGFQRLDSDIHFTNHYSLNNLLTNFGQTTQTGAFPIILSCVSDTF